MLKIAKKDFFHGLLTYVKKYFLKTFCSLNIVRKLFIQKINVSWPLKHPPALFNSAQLTWSNLKLPKKIDIKIWQKLMRSIRCPTLAITLRKVERTQSNMLCHCHFTNVSSKCDIFDTLTERYYFCPIKKQKFLFFAAKKDTTKKSTLEKKIIKKGHKASHSFNHKFHLKVSRYTTQFHYDPFLLLFSILIIFFVMLVLFMFIFFYAYAPMIDTQKNIFKRNLSYYMCNKLNQIFCSCLERFLCHHASGL